MIEKIIRFMAGTLFLLSILLGFYINAYWYLLGIFIALNLMQSALTGFCPMEKILKKCGYK